jgi:low temperature requirement protein LtrA
VARSALGFFVAFFALWWAWMNFTWFASAYDSDDVLYRLSMLVAMVGALILAARIGFPKPGVGGSNPPGGTEFGGPG